MDCIIIKGIKYYFNENDQLHRKNDPAIIYPNAEEYYMEGKRHRIDGPAIIYGNGMKNGGSKVNYIERMVQLL